MCIQANHFLSPDMDKALKAATANEESPLGKKILKPATGKLKNSRRGYDTDMSGYRNGSFFIEIGQDVHFTGGVLEDAINEGVRQGYTDGYLRKSVVKDPLIRENTKDNTPAVIHYSIVSGDKVKITFAPKGFGSEKHESCIYVKSRQMV